MPSQDEDSDRRAVTLQVLGRLGEESLDLIKLALMKKYEIDLNKPQTYTLSKLRAALSVILGDSPSALLVKEIGAEIEALSRLETH